MGTKPIEMYQQLANELTVVLPRRENGQERQQRITIMADRMARTFAEALVQAQADRPTPFWEKFALIVIIVAATMIVIGIPGYLIANAAFNALGI